MDDSTSEKSPEHDAPAENAPLQVRPVNIIVGHTNMDLDCIGSMVLARHLFPGYQPVRSHLVHPSARNLYNLYARHLRFLPCEELRGRRIEHLVVVDTRSTARIREVLDRIEGEPDQVDVFDHHPADTCDIPNARIHEEPCGANTTLLGSRVRDLQILIPPEEATVALTGMYADTGRFTHPNVQPADFQTASYLLGCGASLHVIDHLLRELRDQDQVGLFHVLEKSLVNRTINGHHVQLCQVELEKKVPGLAGVVEKVFEIESPHALFAVFGFAGQGDVLLVARSGKENIRVNQLLEPFGGNGHPGAASALLKGRQSSEVFETFCAYLQNALVPAATALQIMSPQVDTIHQDWKLMDASIFLEKTNHSGAPVVDDTGTLVGFLTLRDIMKGRKAQQMHAPVRGYMNRDLVTAAPDTTVTDIEGLIFRHNIGHLPILDGNRLAGIVTRTDLLKFMQDRYKENRRALRRVQAG